MGVEEQKEEREVLDSIFPDEITGTAYLTIACEFLEEIDVPWDSIWPTVYGHSPPCPPLFQEYAGGLDLQRILVRTCRPQPQLMQGQTYRRQSIESQSS